MANRNVRVIPATRARYSSTPLSEHKKRRVAGYARVSTDYEDQQSSYEAQIDYYTTYIKDHDDWVFVEVYTDEGISGTSTKHREGFKRMISDALDGKIDLIITKSVSRFARNTVDSLTTIRKLKEKGVECFFEKENIWTFDSKGELLITIMSSLAQEESRSISQNCTWGQRKRFADGKVSVAYSRFLGYDKGENGEWIINKDQAKTVREIFQLFLDGLSYKAIANKLIEDGRPTPSGGNNWNANSVRRILSNEKYKGDALLQKYFTVDFLTKKMKVNEGEVQQYYYENHHPAIIDREVFDKVQAEMERRKNRKGLYSGVSIFSSKVICGECGGTFGSKVWHSNDPYRKVIWRCNNKYGKDGSHCRTPHVTEDQLKEAFVKALNDYADIRDEVIENAEAIRVELSDTTDLEEQLSQKTDELNAIAEQINKGIELNSRQAQDQTAYREQYDELSARYDSLNRDYSRLEAEISRKKRRYNELGSIVDSLKNIEAIEAFSEAQWGLFCDHIIVNKDGSMTVVMKDGTKIDE